MGIRARGKAILPVVIGLVVVGVYALFVALYAVDYPQEDDLPALVAFVLKFPGSGIPSLLQRHNEHVVAWARLAAWLFTVAGGGSLSIVAMVWVGQALLTPLYRGLKATVAGLSETNQPWMVLPILCLLFNPQYQVTALWALGVWSNILVLVFALLACRALGTRSYLSAALWALAAALSNGNGIAVFAVGIGILALQCAPWRGWLFWGLAGALAFAALRYALSQGEAAGTQTFEVLALGAVPVSLVAFLGSAMALVGGGIDAALTLTVGAFVLAIGGYYLYRTVRDTWAGKPLSPASAVLLGMLAFVVASGLAVALFRSEKGLAVVTGARYRHYGCLALILAYAMAQRLLPERFRPRLAYAATALGLLTLAVAYPRQIAYRTPFAWRLQADAYNLAYNRNFPQLIISGFDSTYAEAMKAGVLKAPPRLGNAACKQNRTLKSEFHAEVEDKGTDRYICRNRYDFQIADDSDCFPAPTSPDVPCYAAFIGLDSPDTLLFPANVRPRMRAVTGGSLYSCGLKGRYKMALISRDKFYLIGDYPAGKVIVITP